jgi:hypothetical protein
VTDATAQPGAPAAPPLAPVIPAGPPPANATEARAARDGLMADKGFATALFNRDVAATTKWRELGALINGPDPSDMVARAMSTAPPTAIIQNADDVQMRGYADLLRGRGLSELQLRETLEDKPATQAEKDVAARWKQQNLNSKEFAARFHAKEPDAVLSWTAANIVLNAPLKE